MGLTLDVLGRRVCTYVTCDNCGHPILGEPQVDPPDGARDYCRYTHRGSCPDEDDGKVVTVIDPHLTVGREGA